MPRLWTANKNYTDSLNANTRYLVGASNGGCNYQTIPVGSTKRVLHGAAGGACYYGNETVPIPDPTAGNINFSSVASLIQSLYCVGPHGSVIGQYQIARFSDTPQYLSNINALEVYQPYRYVGRDDGNIRFQMGAKRELSESEMSIFNTAKTVQVYAYNNSWVLACKFAISSLRYTTGISIEFRGGWSSFNDNNMLIGDKMRISFLK